MGTEAIIAIIAVVISAAVSAAAAANAAANQQKVADYQVAIHKNQAEAATNAAVANERDARLRLQRAQAHQRALVGGSGLVAEGSPLLVMLDSVQQSELAALKIRHAGVLQAQGADAAATLAQAQGDIARQEGLFNVGVAVAGGASSAARIYAGGAGGGAPSSTATTRYTSTFMEP